MRRAKVFPILLAAAMLAASVGVAACGDDDGGGGGEKSINLTIGDSVPLTGDLSPFGPPGRKAADIATDQIKKAIQEAGVDHQVKVVHEDNQTDPQAAVQAARKLVADGAECLAGAWASADSVATAESVTVREEVLQISPSSTATSLTEVDDDGFLNRVPPADNLQGPVLARAMDDQLKGASGKTVNLGARNDAYGQSFSDAFSAAWEKQGGKMGQTVLYDPEQPSYNSEAQKIAGGNPDAYVIIDFPETYAKVGPALVRSGEWDATKTFVTDGLIAGALFESPGGEAVQGLRGTAPGTPTAGEASKAFDRLYKQSAPRNVERNTFDAQNFDAVVLCYLSAVAAGSAKGVDMKDELRAVTGPPGTKYTWEQLPEAIKALQNGDDIDYEGAAGPIDLDQNGDSTSGVYDVLEFDNGDFKPLKQVPATEGGPG